MSLIDLFHGGGRRRRSDENWLELERRASDAESRAKHVKGAYRYECPQRIHPAMWVYSPHRIPCPWCTIDRLRGQLELVTARPAPRPGGIAVQAPADGAAVAVPVTEPAADVNADTQAVDVSDLRDAIGEGDTAVYPVVAIPAAMPLDPVPPVALTDEQKSELTKWATTTGPRDAGPTEMSAITGHRASVKVQLATTSTD